MSLNAFPVEAPEPHAEPLRDFHRLVLCLSLLLKQPTWPQPSTTASAEHRPAVPNPWEHGEVVRDMAEHGSQAEHYMLIAWPVWPGPSFGSDWPEIGAI